MIVLVLFALGGTAAGFLLLRRVPMVAGVAPGGGCELRVSVIVPARNEETNLPGLLESLQGAAAQVLVVDDGSTDGTAAVAVQYGATAIASAALPEGWTGKTWACHQGALAATGDVLFFLDADVRVVGGGFARGGFARIVEAFAALPENAALSILPFHRTRFWYEELSLFFNIVLAMGAGGFGGIDAPHLFGQSMLVRREMYWKAGGHGSVKGEILENLNFAARVRAAGGTNIALGGRGTLEMRMFPHGLAQLRESWQKAFAAGAGVASRAVLGLSIYWLAAAMLTALLLLAVRGGLWPAIAALYLLNAVQIGWYGRQLGTFRWLTALFYPVALVFYFAVFAQSAWRRKRGGPVTWRGRKV